MKASVVDRHRLDAGTGPNIHLFWCRPRSGSYPKFNHNFKYFGQHVKILWKKGKIHLLGIDTDLDRHTLDADPDPAKWCRSDPIRIHNTDKGTCSENGRQSKNHFTSYRHYLTFLVTHHLNKLTVSGINIWSKYIFSTVPTGTSRSVKRI